MNHIVSDWPRFIVLCEFFVPFEILRRRSLSKVCSCYLFQRWIKNDENCSVVWLVSSMYVVLKRKLKAVRLTIFLSWCLVVQEIRDHMNTSTILENVSSRQKPLGSNTFTLVFNSSCTCKQINVWYFILDFFRQVNLIVTYHGVWENKITERKIPQEIFLPSQKTEKILQQKYYSTPWSVGKSKTTERKGKKLTICFIILKKYNFLFRLL